MARVSIEVMEQPWPDLERSVHTTCGPVPELGPMHNHDMLPIIDFSGPRADTPHPHPRCWMPGADGRRQNAMELGQVVPSHDLVAVHRIAES